MVDSVKNLYSCLVYGFPFIFEKYRDAVTPIVHTKSDDSVTVGTGFFFRNYFITARHCLENSKNIAIKGLTRGQLLRASVKFHKDDNIDLAFFEVVDKNKFQVIDRQDIAKELDSVITIGFPKIPTFLAIQTVEQAQIASRLTVTRGEIAGAGTQYLAKTKMFLITAKIRGGNSGGPVLNAGGCVVGVAVQKASGEGNYDDLGYGSVIPYSYVEEMINGENVDAGKFEFVEFVE